MKDFRRVYDEEGAYHREASGFRRWFLQANYEAIGEACRGRENVLDLACGEGCLSEHLESARLWGIDHSERALALNAALYAGRYERLIAADLRELGALDLPRPGFDAVVCSLSLMYLQQGELCACLDQIVGLLRPGGIFVFSYPTVSRHRAPSPEAAELPSEALHARLVEAGFAALRFSPLCPLVPQEVVQQSVDADAAVAAGARAAFERAALRMTLARCYHWLCQAGLP